MLQAEQAALAQTANQILIDIRKAELNYFLEFFN
jgi:hypothetical protein